MSKSKTEYDRTKTEERNELIDRVYAGQQAEKVKAGMQQFIDRVHARINLGIDSVNTGTNPEQALSLIQQRQALIGIQREIEMAIVAGDDAADLLEQIAEEEEQENQQPIFRR